MSRGSSSSSSSVSTPCSSSSTQAPPTRGAAPADASYSYGYVAASPSTSGGWFSGLRAKISQLTGISEWMSQLGMGNAEQDGNGNTADCSTMKATASRPPDEDVLSYNDLSLDDCAASPDREQQVWDWGTCLLADLDSSHTWSDTLERQHFGPLGDLITVGHKGQGHQFSSINLLHPTWCDKCGDFIWGILKQAVKCDYCNFTCHERCRDLVTLDCRSAGSSLASGEFPSIYPKLLDGTLGTIPKELNIPPISPMSPTKTPVPTALVSPSKISSSTLPKSFAPLPSPSTMKAPLFVQAPSGQTLRVQEVYVKEDTPFEWTAEEKERDLEGRIEEYNRTADGLGIMMSPDGASFSGYLQVHMNFTRPISVVAGEKPPTVYDVVNTGKSSSTMNYRTITSFFLPRNTVKTININSKMTSRQMIVTLLRKFRVADNPRKFALYECSHSEDTASCTLMRKMTRIGDDVCPLKVVLSWKSAKCGKALVLQENDTGDILWDAFEVPELENFLRILGMEEQQYQWQTRQRYNQYRYNVDEELRRRGHSVGERASAPPLEMAPSPPAADYNPYGTSDSMVVSDVFHTIREGDLATSHQENHDEEPAYVNIEELRHMQESTRL